MGMDRRKFLTASGLMATGAAIAGPAAAQATGPAYSGESPLRPLPAFTPQQQYRIGYTSNTRGGWEGDPWKGMSEGREVGFRYFEIFGSQFAGAAPGRPAPTWAVYYPHDAEGLMRRMHELGAHFVSITGGAPGGSVAFHDPAQQKAVIDNHFNMARFSRKFGTDVWKTNLGPRRPEGGATDADLKQMAITCNELGKRMLNELGMHLAVHPHLGNQLQDEREVNYIMENTDERYVGLTLDTGHITMAGMDPLALAKKLGKRVLEYHLKDVHPKDLGGAKIVPDRTVDMMKTPYFFPLGKGGVDFLGLKAYLDSTGWRGFLNVELDTSPFIPPKESARISANYIETTLNIPL
jgi:inosose dehydratase